MRDTILEVKNVSKIFSPFFSSPVTAVSNFSCAIKRGEIVGLLGLNGAGKTTLIQMLLGTLLPTSGSIRYFGLNLDTHRSEILEKVGFSASYSNLPLSMRVFEALNFCSYLYSLENRKQAIFGVVKQFNLTDLLSKRINQLSSGQLARVNLAKAFLNNPALLFLDEPTNYLDPQAAKLIRSFILKKNKTSRLTVLIASHNMQEVFDLCDRVILMHNGKEILTGKPETIMQKHFKNKITFTGVKVTEALTKAIKNLDPNFHLTSTTLTIEVLEKEIGATIQLLSHHGLRYKNIHLDVPTLEQVFNPSFIAQYENN
jgi:ABC-2 type transport system ATP-binding protein